MISHGISVRSSSNSWRFKAGPSGTGLFLSSFSPIARVTLLGLVVFAVGCGGGGSSGGGGAAPAPSTTPNPTLDVTLEFTELAIAAGLSRQWGYVTPIESDPEFMASGLAAVDYDADGDIDVYVVGGDAEPNRLFQNQGDGTFVDVAADVGLDLVHKGSGPTFADIDNDGDLDLFIGAVEGDPYYLLENQAGSFVDVTVASGIQLVALNTFSAAFGDYDRDGDLDLVLTHWGNLQRDDTETLWRNRGDGTFESASVGARIAATLIESADPAELQIRSPGSLKDNSFTPNFSDIDNDGDLDLLIASDFKTSQVFGNNGDGSFTRRTERAVIKDQAGMGAAVADFDNDGDMDWFVTSIYKVNEGTNELIGFGNRLYANDGAGEFTDVTDTAGVANGGWAWASCFADFDNDGNLDIVHVNGWREESSRPENNYVEDQIRLFRSEGDGTFNEQAGASGMTDRGQGRGLACFDADRDGDLDVLVSNNDDRQLVFYRNDTSTSNHYLGVNLVGFGVGARVTVAAGNRSQVREVRAGSNFVSQNPTEVHFGLGSATGADVTVDWLDGTQTTLTDVTVDQLLTIDKSGLPTEFALNVFGGEGGGDHSAGETIDVVAAAGEDGYFFSRWTVEGADDGVLGDPLSANTTLTMPNGPVSLIANYVPGVAPAANVSVARRWNEVLLQAIRNDFARPTVHARNLFHASAAGYDAWSAYAVADGTTEVPWLLGQTRAGGACGMDTFTAPADIDAARVESLSYAIYRLIRHRFASSPGANAIRRDADALMSYLGYDIDDSSTAYSTSSFNAARLGNHIAQCYIDFGLADGANEQNDYANQVYTPVNQPLEPELPGNPDIEDLNRWQPLALQGFVDQAGNPIDETPEFLGAEWGQVVPFALSQVDRTTHSRSGESYEYWVYHNPDAPPTFDGSLAEEFKWSHSLVAIWSSQLDPSGVADSGNGAELIDISPANVGNISTYPAGPAEHGTFYDRLDGGDASTGYSLNPVTGQPYAAQMVPRGDYARVLAEFWADGPDSETPPGHWFVILNEVNDHPMAERRFGGGGSSLGLLEWDVKAYFTLGGTMHDAAITAWSIKGWYDYIRPISSLRAMADLGQSTDSELASYNVDGIPLEPGYIELVAAEDPLAGETDEHVGKIKLLAWRGPDYIANPQTDFAGVGWILAENWWPYQRPSFVTPPFAGYVSGHSTYSRAAAEVLTALTGDAYFPGGMSEFEIKRNEFLVFEEGPSVDMTLQWATYRDASDQCSLSRIWGGIHPPVDDIPGRLIGISIGMDGFSEASAYFAGTAP